MDQVIQIDGFIALYIFMLAGFVGHEIIGKVPANPTYSTYVWFELYSWNCL